MKGLIIKEPWIDLILEGKKTWEIRSSGVNIRGEIYLIKSGTKKIFGKAELVDSILLDEDTFHASTDLHQIKEKGLPYKKTHAWVLRNAIYLPEPIPYNHPHGAIIWVNI